MSFLKLLCHRNGFANERNTKSARSKDSVSFGHPNSISHTYDASREAPTTQQHPIVARYYSLFSTKRRFRVKNVFRRVEPINSTIINSLASTCSTSSIQKSLPLNQTLSGDLLPVTPSIRFPSTTALNTRPIQCNITGEVCTNMSQSQSSCSYRFKKNKKNEVSDTYTHKRETKQGVSRDEYPSNSVSESRNIAPSESQQRSSRQILMNLLEFPSNLNVKSFPDTKLEKRFVKEKQFRSARIYHTPSLISRKSSTKKYREKQSSEKKNNRVEFAATPTVNSAIQTERELMDKEAQTDITNSWNTDVIDSDHRSVAAFTEHFEIPQYDLPKCECLKRANSSCGDRKKTFLNYKREYHQFLANETKSKTSVGNSHSSGGMGRRTLAKEEDQSRVTTQKRNKSTITTTGCVYCDVNFLSHPKDNESHIVCSRGDVFNRRYIVMEERGRGTFGKVFECLDVSASQRMVAVKVVRSTKKYSNSARIEASILRYIQKKDRFNTQPIIRLNSAFMHFDHVCLVFPLMGPSLYAYMKTSKMAFGLENVKSFAYQILKAVKFLHRIGLTHTDLKPENVLLVNPNMTLCAQRKREVMDTRICVIDLGSATFHFEKQPTLISTRHYRAPEVVLQLGWSYSCDIWSVGCILLELYSGYVFFRTHDNQEHLQLMERALGRFPMAMVKNTKTGYFFKGFVKDTGSQRVINFLPLDAHMKNNTPDTSRFRHLLRQLMNLDPSKRVTADAACRLSFFSSVRSDTSPSPVSATNSNDSHTSPSRSYQLSYSLTSGKDTASAAASLYDNQESDTMHRWGCDNSNNRKAGGRRHRAMEDAATTARPAVTVGKKNASTNIMCDDRDNIVSLSDTPKPAKRWTSDSSDTCSASPAPTSAFNFVVSPKLEIDNERRSPIDEDESDSEGKVTDGCTWEAGDTCQSKL